MTDDTQPEALRLANLCSNLTRYSMDAHLIAAELRRQHARIAELESELEAVGAGGVSGPLIGRAALSANAGEPVAWQYRSLRDNGAWFDCTKERFEMRCTQPEIWETRALYAAPPTAQAEGWTKAEPLIARSRGEWHEDDGPVVWWAWKGHGWAGESPWCGTPLDSDWPGYHTHWTPAPPPPTSAEGVEHG